MLGYLFTNYQFHPKRIGVMDALTESIIINEQTNLPKNTPIDGNESTLSSSGRSLGVGLFVVIFAPHD